MKTTRLVPLFLLLVGSGAAAQNQHVLSAGGTEATIPGGTIRGTIGQPVIGPVTLVRRGRTLQGFWYTVDGGSFPTSVPYADAPPPLIPYPNPATTVAELRGDLPPARDLHIELVDPIGATRRILFDGAHTGGELRIPIPIDELPVGGFLITVASSQGRGTTTLIVTR